MISVPMSIGHIEAEVAKICHARKLCRKVSGVLVHTSLTVLCVRRILDYGP